MWGGGKELSTDIAKLKYVREKYGFLPLSVWHIPNKGVWKKLIRDDASIFPLKKDYDTDIHSIRVKYSEFHPKVAERIIRYWSNPGDHIVDPFSGRITRLVVSLALGRSYEGYEIGKKTYEYTLEKVKPVISILKKMRNLPEYKLWLADGCLLEHTPDLSADLVFTCPPYWKVERYEKVEGQLSEIPSYEEFLDRMRLNAENVFRVLKWNKFAIYVVADFRFNKKLYLFHKDLIDIFSDVGFEPWDVVINVLNSPILPVGSGQDEKMKYTRKVHEYILVFKKVRRRLR